MSLKGFNAFLGLGVEGFGVGARLLFGINAFFMLVPDFVAFIGTFLSWAQGGYCLVV